LSKKKNHKRLGEINYNTHGSKMEIIRYSNCDDIDVYFPEYDWVLKNTRYSSFKRGIIKCPYEKSVYNVGFLGEGDYKVSENGKHTKVYRMWQHMLERTHSEKYKDKKPSYRNCEVCEEWLNFNEFGKWFDENYYEIEGQTMHLDKDIKKKGNKIYSPDTCSIVPGIINSLFTKNDKNRGEFPIGVSKDINNDKVKLKCSCHTINNKGELKLKNLGRFELNEVEDAFNVYKECKEHTIKQIAEMYKDDIPDDLYNAMMNYNVEIDD